jgi:hypothetical protein
MKGGLQNQAIPYTYLVHIENYHVNVEVERGS